MPARRFRCDWPLLAFAVVLVLPLYWPTLRYDLFQDDFLLLRPWPPEHLVASWFGGWFVSENRDFYRPIAVLLYRAMFYPFGLNTRVLHILPLITMAVLAWMLGRFVRRETGSWSLAAVGTAIGVLHPTGTVAVGPWLVNQYQGLVSGALLATLLWWQTARRRSWPWSLPLFIPIVIGAFTKETGLIIPAVLVAIAVARAWWTRDLPPPPRWFVVGGLGVFVALNLWRIWVLGGLGGDGGIEIRLYAAQYYEGWYASLFTPIRMAASAPIKWTFAAASAGLVAAGTVALLRRDRGPAGALFLTGALILAAAALPTSIIFSRDRLTPHTVGAALMLTGGFAFVQEHLRGRARVLLAGLVIVFFGTSTLLSQIAIARFSPCNSVQLTEPEMLLDEPRSTPPELIRWLGVIGSEPCSEDTHAPFFRATSRITWGVIEQHGDRPVYERLHVWTKSRVVGLLDARGTAVVVEIRHPRAGPHNPVRVGLDAGGLYTRELVLTSPEWTRITVPLVTTWRTWTRQMHRLELKAHPDVPQGLEMRPLDVVY